MSSKITHLKTTAGLIGKATWDVELELEIDGHRGKVQISTPTSFAKDMEATRRLIKMIREIAGEEVDL